VSEELSANTSVDTPVEHVDIDKSVFTDGADSILSSTPVDVSSAVLEPSFSSLGLGHGWPSGWLQSLLEVLHAGAGLEWWQAIGITTVCLRIVIFPIMIIAQKSIVQQNKHLPVTQDLQVKAQMASIQGNLDQAAFYNKALNNYMLAENCHPYKTLLPVMTQAMFFTSMFFGLRGMTNAPVESMKTGGLYWFTDLTLADPTMALPLITASTIYLQLYLGADGMNTANVPPFMKKVMYILPVMSVPVMINFPTALNIYWLTNNFISLIQSRVVKYPPVRERLGIGEMTQWKPEDLPMTNFYDELKREMRAKRSKEDKLEATRAREKKEFQEEERKKRQKLLAGFEEERKQQQSK